MHSQAIDRLIFVDSNVYFRIADSFHPLISQEFGDPPIKLRVVPDLDRELKKEPRLCTKFFWALSPQYAEDRHHYLRVNSDKKIEISTNCQYIRETVHDLELGLSSVDIFILAFALAFSASVATDDKPMTIVAKEYAIKVYDTLDLMKLMLNEKRINLDEIKNAISTIESRDDIPNPKEFWKKQAVLFC